MCSGLPVFRLSCCAELGPALHGDPSCRHRQCELHACGGVCSLERTAPEGGPRLCSKCMVACTNTYLTSITQEPVFCYQDKRGYKARQRPEISWFPRCPRSRSYSLCLSARLQRVERRARIFRNSDEHLAAGIHAWLALLSGSITHLEHRLIHASI